MIVSRGEAGPLTWSERCRSLLTMSVVSRGDAPPMRDQSKGNDGTGRAVPVLSPSVRDALSAGRPVVALESTIISHGLPRPGNLAAATSFEALLLSAGVTPATIALIDGVPKVGLTA